MTSSAAVWRVEPVFVERVWGVDALQPYFPHQDRRIGEVWYPVSPTFPLLVKFIFTSERLSVQVHPEDAYARQYESSRGKTEMWHILDAEPGAEIALGFRERVTEQQVRKAIEDRTVEELLNWVPVHAGETFFTPAGVVHAIGAGIALCEIQQNSDITYRLYDYGRRRELHLDKGLTVASLDTYEGRRELPVTCEHFSTETLHVGSEIEKPPKCDHLLIVLEGSGTINGHSFHPMDVWFVPAGVELVAATASGPSRLLRTRC